MKSTQGVGACVGTGVGLGDTLGEGDGNGLTLGEGDGNGVGRGDGIGDGAHVCVSGSVSQQRDPMSLSVVTNHFEVTWLERAWTWVGMSEQSLFELSWKAEVILIKRPSSVSRGWFNGVGQGRVDR